MFLSEQRTHKIVARITLVCMIVVAPICIIGARFESTKGRSKDAMVTTNDIKDTEVTAKSLFAVTSDDETKYTAEQFTKDNDQSVVFMKSVIENAINIATNLKTNKDVVITLLSVESTPIKLASNGKEYRYYEVMEVDGTWIHMDIELQEYLYELCIQYEIEEHYKLLLCQFFAESRYEAIVSKTNDYGIAQINKCNHKWLKKELNITDFMDDKQSLLCGTYMMSNYLKKYSQDIALGKYNTGKAIVNNYAKSIMTIYHSKRVREFFKEEN